MLDDLSQHILDIAENSVNAGASEVSIIMSDRLSESHIKLEIEDNGRGMDKSFLEKVVDPFSTSRTTRRVGLGIPFLKQSAELCEGEFSIESKPGKGTRVRATFLRDSVDTPPFGDIPSSISSLLAGSPETLWIYRHITDEGEFILDSREIADILGDVSMFRKPEIITWIREYIGENIEALKNNVN